MSLTTRGPNATSPAKLPALLASRAEDPDVRRSIEALREWVEVRLGARGDRFERAVTFRELRQELQDILSRISVLEGTSSGTSTTSATDLTSVQSAIAALSAELTTQANNANETTGQLKSLLDRKGDFSSNTTTSVANELVLFSDTSGKVGKRATGTGYAKLASGVLGTLTVNQTRQDLGEKVVVLTDAATIAVDASLSNNFRVVLGGNRTLDNPTNLLDGQVVNIRIKQDGTGSRTLAYSSKYKFPGGSPPVLSTGANVYDFLSCQYDAADDTLFCVLNKAFA